jgi:phage/plasmid primase, P4 family, C-terminal domain
MNEERRKEKRWDIDNIPRELKDLSIWVGFKFLPQPGKKPKKVPINIKTGGPAKSNDSSTWCSFDELMSRVDTLNLDAIGFAITSPYVGIDIDGCIADDGMSSLARTIIATLNSYTEHSPGGKGAHIICKGEITRECKFNSCNVEMYSKNRFFTITGRIIGGKCSIETREDELRRVFADIQEIEKQGKSVKAILNKVKRSKDKDAFFRLYEGNWQADYPSQSEADLALCNKLAFWTVKDAALMDLVFRSSALIRPKWDEAHFSDGRTYGADVIAKAIAGCGGVYSAGNSSAHTPKKINSNEVADAILEKHRLINFADTYYEYRNGCYRSLFIEEVQKWIKDVCGAMFSASRLRNVLVALKTETFIKPDIINGVSFLNVKNGLYDIDNMRLIPHSADVYSINQLNVTYRDDADCPVWTKSLDQIFENDAERIELLQEFFGYCLTRENDYEKALFLFGEGANGKSVVLYVLEELIGKENCSSIALEKFNDSHYIARLRDKLINISLETNAKTNVYDNMFKAIVTGDTISADEKYGQPFQFKPYCKLLFSTNNMPRVGDKSEGYYRRLLILPFNRQFNKEERDHKLKYKIASSELDGIFLWALNGLKRLRNRGYFEESASMLNVKDEYRKENNNVIIFIEEMCVLDAHDDISKDDLYQAYNNWCLDSGYRSLSKITFGRELIRQYASVNKGRCSSARTWKGIRLRREGEADDSERPY